MEFIKTIANRRHPQHREMVRWYGGPFHPTDFGEAEVAARVRDIAAKRKVALDALDHGRRVHEIEDLILQALKDRLTLEETRPKS